MNASRKVKVVNHAPRREEKHRHTKQREEAISTSIHLPHFKYLSVLSQSWTYTTEMLVEIACPKGKVRWIPKVPKQKKGINFIFTPLSTLIIHM